MNIEKSKNGTFKATMPCGKVFGGMYKDALIAHCQEWQKRQNELAIMLAEHGYTVEKLNEYDYKVINGKVFVFSHLYNDSFTLNIETQQDVKQVAIAEDLAIIAECEEALKDTTITATRKKVIEGFLHNAKKRLNALKSDCEGMTTKQAIDRLQANIVKDSETLATIQNSIESGSQAFDNEFLISWHERVESCKRGIEALNDNSGYIKCFYNRAYLVLNVINDDVICVIKS